MKNGKIVGAHLSILGAEVIWGLMAPIGKDAMLHGFDGMSVVSFRVVGAALLFWIGSLFMPREYVPWRDVFVFALAALFGVVFNQCLFTLGLSYTSPVNASIVATSMPIFAMLLAFLILREPITLKKMGGVLIGCAGAVVLISSSATAANGRVGNLVGDLMCLGAQFSFALYLSLFYKIIRRYNVFTINKWMFLWASVYVLPFSRPYLAKVSWAEISFGTWAELAYVVLLGTFFAFLLMMVAQRVLRPTVVSVYNYVQPVVSVFVSLLTGLGVFTLRQGVAMLLVFTGVWLVIKSKSKRDVEAAKAQK